MRISAEAKREISALEIKRECCLTAGLSALIHTAGLLNFSSEGISVVIENESVFSFVNNALKTLYGEAAEKRTGSVVIRGGFVQALLVDLKILRLFFGGGAGRGTGRGSDATAGIGGDDGTGGGDGTERAGGLKVEEGINPSLVREECCAKSYLKGAFIGGGSLTVSGGYHLEFACASKKLRDGLIRLLGGFEIKAGAVTRGESFVAYLKDRDSISDALVLMGADKTMLKLNSLFVKRSVRQDAARAANCDMANLNRLVLTSVAQCEAIAKLKDIKNPKLKEVAKLRLENPDLSYEELSVKLGVSKSTVKYRLKKLLELST